MNSPHHHLDLQAETVREYADLRLSKDLDFVSYTTYFSHACNIATGEYG